MHLVWCTLDEKKTHHVVGLFLCYFSLSSTKSLNVRNTAQVIQADATCQNEQPSFHQVNISPNAPNEIPISNTLSKCNSMLFILPQSSPLSHWYKLHLDVF